MDNLFTSINLFKFLKTKKIWAIGTIRLNRMGGAQQLLKGKKELKKEGRGSYDYRVDANSNVMLLTWMDNGPVQLISSFTAPTLGEDVQRWCGKEKKNISVPCPTVVCQYNKHMGGVDLADMLLALYRIKVGTRKWYYHIMYYCIGVCIINGWILYKRHCMQKQVPTKEIKSLLREIASSLVQENKRAPRGPGRRRSDIIVPVKKRKPAAHLPLDIIRYDCVDHFPVFGEKQQRCKLCISVYSRVYCSKCVPMQHLCLVSARNCFFEFYHK